MVFGGVSVARFNPRGCAKKMKNSVTTTLVIPVICLAFATVMFRYTDLDVTISNLVYLPERTFNQGESNLWSLLYDYGHIPAIVIGVVGLLVFLVGWITPKLACFRKISVFFVLFLIVGPGLIVNELLKEHWGRPRPVQVLDFDGKQQFLSVWSKGVAGEGASFPSGHAAIGFYLCAPFFVLWADGRKHWALMVLALGMGYGLLMGLGRIIQGAHFASDVLWSAGFIYLTGILFYYLLRFDRGVWWE